MNENQMKVITESLVEASKLGTVNALTYIKLGFEAYKKVAIPIVGERSYVRIPYREDKAIQNFVDFMLVYLNEAIKGLDKKDKSE